MDEVDLDELVEPRLKNIGAVRLYRSDEHAAHAQLGAVLTRPIRWELIAQQYDEMVLGLEREPEERENRWLASTQDSWDPR